MTGPGAAQDSTLFFIGTATTLIRYGDMTVRTDPNFLHRGQRAYLGRGLTARRRGIVDRVRFVDRGNTVSLSQPVPAGRPGQPLG